MSETLEGDSCHGLTGEALSFDGEVAMELFWTGAGLFFDAPLLPCDALLPYCFAFSAFSFLN